MVAPQAVVSEADLEAAASMAVAEEVPMEEAEGTEAATGKRGR